MTYGHLRADCLYTGISSGPSARYRAWESLYLSSDQLLHNGTKNRTWKGFNWWMTYEGHSRSSEVTSFSRLYITSYLWSIVTVSVFWTVCEILSLLAYVTVHDLQKSFSFFSLVTIADSPVNIQIMRNAFLVSYYQSCWLNDKDKKYGRS